QFGYSQEHCPDLPQVRAMPSALDPRGMSVPTDVVRGQQADDPLYVPASIRVRESLSQCGVLYVRDCKIGAVETRAFLQLRGDASVWPWAVLQLPPEVLEAALVPIWTGQHRLTRITRLAASGQRAYIAEGYEQLEAVTAVVTGEAVTWMERRLVVRL